MVIQGDESRRPAEEGDEAYIRSAMEVTLEYQSALFTALLVDREVRGVSISYGLADLLRSVRERPHASINITDGIWRVMETLGNKSVEGICYSSLMFVKPPYRARGYGKMLSVNLIEHAKRHGSDYFAYSTLNPRVVHMETQLLGEPVLRHPDEFGMDIYVHRLS